MVLKKVEVIVIAMVITLSSIAAASAIVESLSSDNNTLQNPSLISPPSGSFAYVSEFAAGSEYSDYGWSMISGNSPPFVTNAQNYFGEPSLAVSNGTALFSNRNVTTGDQSVSFQFAINAQVGNGTFAVTNSSGDSIVWVSVSGGNISVGAVDSNSSFSGLIPAGSTVDNGWTLVSGNLHNTSNGSVRGWILQVFVDRTVSVLANISAPMGFSYGGIELMSSGGTVFFTGIIFSTDKMSEYIPGYNNMEGYGQGSGFVVNLLKPFTIVHANFILYNWSVTRYSTLSFQINAMNLTGAMTPTAKGFFQLGVDLDPNGKIAPWYVGGGNAIAVYFKNYVSPDFMPGFATPNGTRLGLTIQYIPQGKLVFFQIIDYNMSGKARFWNTTVPYSGPEFYATYTQLETSSLDQSLLGGYRFNGTMFNISYGSDISRMVPLNNSYMLPFSIDTPATWSLTYYSDTSAGYRQVD